MGDTPIHEWIQEWQNIKPLDIKSYAANLMADHDTTEALLRVFEDPNLHHLLDGVCGQLLTFYRSREPNLVHFSLQCLPPLMHAYLNAVASRDQKTCKPTETLLLGMYNLEVVDERGLPRVVSFRMPTLIKQSVYHMPLHMAPSSLTEHSLSRLELGDAFSVEWGPLPQAQRIRAANRQRVLSALMTVYNRYLSQMSEPALQAACRAIIRICGQGFTMTAPPLDPRLTVSPELQLEFLHAIYFIITPSLHLDPGDPTYTYCRYEAVTPAATQALEAVTFRGQYEVNARVTVAANAMRNSLNISPAGLTDSQLNLNEMPSVTSLPSVNKFIITNASFRTKKLPEDIDPPPEDTTDSSGPVSIARTLPPSPAATTSHKLRRGIHRIRRRIRFGRGFSEPDPDPDPNPGPNPDTELAEGSSSSGEDPLELLGSVSTESFRWILTREEAEQLRVSQRGLRDWRRRSYPCWQGPETPPLPQQSSGASWDRIGAAEDEQWIDSDESPGAAACPSAVLWPGLCVGPSAGRWVGRHIGPLARATTDCRAGISSDPSAIDFSADPSAGPAAGLSAAPEHTARPTAALDSLPVIRGSCGVVTEPAPAPAADRQADCGLTPSMVTLQQPGSPPSSQTASMYSASDGGRSSDDDIPIQPGAAHDGEPLSAIAEQTEDEQTADAPATKAKLKDRRHRPAERERSGPDKHVTAMLAALPGLVKKRTGEEKRRLDSGGERGSGAERGARKGDSKRAGRRPASTAAAGASNGAPSSARNSLALNGDEEWPGPPLARIEAGELRVVSSGSESATPRRERRETDSSSVTSTASDEAVAAAHARSEPAVVYSVRRESLAVTASARSTDV